MSRTKPQTDLRSRPKLSHRPTRLASDKGLLSDTALSEVASTVGCVDKDEARAVANSIVIEVEPELAEHLDDEQLGQVVSWPRPYGFEFTAVAKPGLSDGQAAAFDEWVRERAFHLALRGDPEHVDGWYRRSSDGGWQITCRLVWTGDGAAPAL